MLLDLNIFHVSVNHGTDLPSAPPLGVTTTTMATHPRTVSHARIAEYETGVSTSTLVYQSVGDRQRYDIPDRPGCCCVCLAA